LDKLSNEIGKWLVWEIGNKRRLRMGEWKLVAMIDLVGREVEEW
jgi:hypothetical protein